MTSENRSLRNKARDDIACGEPAGRPALRVEVTAQVLCPITRRTLERRAEAIKRWWPGWDSVHTDARELVRREREFKRIVARLKAAAPAPAGLIYTGQCKATGTTISVYDGEPAGMDTAAGRWRTVCETHGAICSHRTRTLAMHHAPAPEWCEECREIMRPPADGGRKPADEGRVRGYS